MPDNSSHAIMFRVNNIEITDDEVSPVCLRKDFHLFPKSSVLLWDSLELPTQLAISQWCGMHEEIMLRNRSLVAYSATNNSDLDDRQLARLLYAMANMLDGLFNTLWIWRDHAASIHSGWSLNTQSDRFFKITFASCTSLCNGTSDVIAVSLEELKQALDLTNLLFPQKEPRTSSSEIVHTEQHRLGRALRFISAARGTTGSSVKLANYTFAMEALLSWHDPEPTLRKEGAKARITRIVRSLVSDSREIDQHVGEIVKEMFRVRDKVAHGQVLGARGITRLNKAVQETDHLLRKLIQELFNNSETHPFICQSLNVHKSREFQQYLDGLGGGPGN